MQPFESVLGEWIDILKVSVWTPVYMVQKWENGLHWSWQLKASIVTSFWEQVRENTVHSQLLYYFEQNFIYQAGYIFVHIY